MSGLDKDLIPDLVHAFHASDEGRSPFNPYELDNLDSLIKTGFVDVSICNKDKRSTHSAKTCKVKLGWLSPKGAEAAKRYFDENLDGLVEEVNEYFDSLNPRVRSVLRFMLTITMDPSLNYLKFYFSKYEDSLRIFEKLLPDRVHEDFDKAMELLKELGLIDIAATEHVVSGWKTGETVSASSIKRRLLYQFGQVDLPLILDLLLAAYANIYAEYNLTRYKLHVERRFDLTDYLIILKSYRVPPERVIYQYSNIHIYEPSVINVDWDKIERISDRIYGAYYIESKIDIGSKYDAVKFTHAYLPFEYVAAVEKRLEITENLIKKAIEEWIETGSILEIGVSDHSLDSLIRRR